MNLFVFGSNTSHFKPTQAPTPILIRSRTLTTHHVNVSCTTINILQHEKKTLSLLKNGRGRKLKLFSVSIKFHCEDKNGPRIRSPYKHVKMEINILKSLTDITYSTEENSNLGSFSQAGSMPIIVSLK